MTWTPEEIRGLRDSLGLSREQFARRLNISYWTITRWETGQNRVSLMGKSKLNDLRKEVTR